MSLLYAGPAYAQEAQLFVPTSAWLVGSASVLPAGPGVTLPCVMANQFDNGFTIRLSGGGQRIMAMAVDFRQAAFTPGSSHNVNIEMPPVLARTLEGTAYNEATLIINTQEEDALYNALSSSKTMTVGLGDQAFEFAMLGISEGLHRMEECYGGRQSAVAAQRETGPLTPLPQDGLDAEGAKAKRAPQPMQSATAGVSKQTPAVTTAYELAKNWSSAGYVRNNPDTPLMQARKADGETASLPYVEEKAARRWDVIGGTSLREVLGAWAARAGAELIWLPSRDFTVAASHTFEGSFAEAVGNLLEEYSHDKGLRPLGRIYAQRGAGHMVLLIEEEPATGE